MRLRFTTLPCLLTTVSLALTACGDRGNSSNSDKGPKDDSPVVATIGDRSITANDLKAKLEEQPPFVRARYATLEKKKEFLDNQIRFELLVQEARQRGLDKDPEVRATLEKVMVQKLLRTQQESAAGAVSDEELRKYYDEHRDEFIKPERVRVSHVFFVSPKGDAKRNEAQAAATKLLAELKRQEPAALQAAFEQAARTRSEDGTTKGAGGDLGYRTREELSQVWGPVLAEAAFGLKTMGELTTVVTTEQGVHLVQLTGRQAGMNQDFDSVKSRIENRLLTERRARGLDDFIAGLRQKTAVEIKEDALDQLKVDEATQAAQTAE
jgi:parvulin-like peptidyl-prolyl isomerase